MAYFSVLGKFAVPTSGATVDFNVSGLTTTPVSYEAYLVKATGDFDASTSNVVANAALCFGVCDGTNEAYAAITSQDAVGVSNCFSVANNDAVARLLDASQSTVVQLSHNSFLADTGSGAGVRLNVDTAAPTGWAIVFRFYLRGDWEAGIHTSSGTEDGETTETLSFDPRVGTFHSIQGVADGTILMGSRHVHGFAALNYPDDTMSQASAAVFGADNVNVAEKVNHSSGNYAIQDVDNGFEPFGGWDAAEVEFETGQFRVTTRLQSGAHRILYLVGDPGPDAVAWAGNVTTKTSTGLQEHNDPGFPPDSWAWAMTGQRNVDQVYLGGGANPCGYGIFDADDEHVLIAVDEDFQTTMDTASIWATNAILLRFNTGTGGSTHLEADFSQFIDDGVELDYQNAPTPARNLPTLVIGQLFRVSGDLQTPSMQVAATGQQCFQASSALTLAAVQLAAAAQLCYQASGDLAMPAVQADAIGQVCHQASGDLELPAVQADATGQECFQASGAVQIPAMELAAAGQVCFQASGAVGLPAMQLEAAGQLCHSAMGAPSIPALNLAATGQVCHEATGAVQVPAMQLDAAGQLCFQASGALALPAMELVGVGTTDSVANIPQCDVDLAASYDGIAELAASYDGTGVHTASYDGEDDHGASFDVVGEHGGSYDGEADLDGSIC